jgi:Cu(I)-responsive transcriptional regulator
MKIGELARATAVKSETIRFYERIGLLPAPERTEGNYRDYGPPDRERLNFIRHARRLGFEIADIRSLLGLADQPENDCGEVGRIASGHLAAVDEKIALLERLRSELGRMVSQCEGGRISDCRIMNSLADVGEPTETDKPPLTRRRRK